LLNGFDPEDSGHLQGLGVRAAGQRRIVVIAQQEGDVVRASGIFFVTFPGVTVVNGVMSTGCISGGPAMTIEVPWA
jgi:hypothetical protein